MEGKKLLTLAEKNYIGQIKQENYKAPKRGKGKLEAQKLTNDRTYTQLIINFLT